MDYLKEYGINEEKIKILEDMYNENIINFIIDNKLFIKEKLDFLKKGDYNIWEILKNNIRIFLEIISELKRKVHKMEVKQYTKKQIENVLTDQRVYSKI